MNLAGFGEKYAGIRKNIYGCRCFSPVLLQSGMPHVRLRPVLRYVVRGMGLLFV